jgi:hypothetical protein
VLSVVSNHSEGPQTETRQPIDTKMGKPDLVGEITEYEKSKFSIAQVGDFVRVMSFFIGGSVTVGDCLTLRNCLAVETS